MRIKAGDPGANDIRVFLDNVEQKNCYAVDDEEGWADVYLTDPQLATADGGWPAERKYGQIRIERIT